MFLKIFSKYKKLNILVFLFIIFFLEISVISYKKKLKNK